MMKCGFSIDFSMTSGQNKVLRPSESTSKTHISSFVTLQKSSFGEHKVRKMIFAAMTTRTVLMNRPFRWRLERHGPGMNDDLERGHFWVRLERVVKMI